MQERTSKGTQKYLSFWLVIFKISASNERLSLRILLNISILLISRVRFLNLQPVIFKLSTKSLGTFPNDKTSTEDGSINLVNCLLSGIITE